MSYRLRDRSSTYLQEIILNDSVSIILNIIIITSSDMLQTTFMSGYVSLNLQQNIDPIIHSKKKRNRQYSVDVCGEDQTRYFIYILCLNR